MVQYVKEQRVDNKAKPMVTEMIFKQKTLEFSKELGINGFVCSRTFFHSFQVRNGLRYRLPTHRPQQNLKTDTTKFQDSICFLNKLNVACNDYVTDLIINMDETPCYYDHQKKEQLIL